ncbi:unnamed protein product, partial [Laminaria digitata]
HASRARIQTWRAVEPRTRLRPPRGVPSDGGIQWENEGRKGRNSRAGDDDLPTCNAGCKLLRPVFARTDSSKSPIRLPTALSTTKWLPVHPTVSLHRPLRI